MIGFYAAGAMGQGGGGGGGFTFPPALILDPTDLSTLFQDSAGTVPVTADGDPVGRWNDKSGNGRDFIQATSGSRPVYKTSGGKHWIDFTIGQFMYGVSAGMLSWESVGLFIGYRAVSGTSDYANIIGVPYAGSHTAPYWVWNLCARTSGGYELGFTNNTNQLLNQNADAAAVGNDVCVALGYSGMWDSTNEAVWWGVGRANGTLFTSSSAGTLTQTYANNVAPYIGASVGGGSDRFQGRIYGILLADATVTSQAWIDEWEDWIDARLP